MIEILNIDCMEYMKSCKNNAFDLAIVDPPYGIGEDWKKSKKGSFYSHESSYKNNSCPGVEYFDELFRVSKNQIIWGGNYYTEFLPPRNSWIIWEKKINFDKQHMSEGELAWTSFNKPVRIVELAWCGFIRCEPRHGNHPHEKPIKLYKWMLEKYTMPGQRILDTHLGSGSSAIAAHYGGFDFVGCELDKDYYKATQERFNDATRQRAMF